MATMDKVFSEYQARLSVLEQSTNPFAKGIAWMNGDLGPLSDARVPFRDQGFLRGDLTYDVIGVWDGRFFRLDDHLSRLEAGCKKLRLNIPIPRAQVKQTLVDMVAQSGIRDAYVGIVVTRGLQTVRGAKGKYAEMKNHLYMYIEPYIWVMPPEVQKTGGSVIIARTVRRTPPGAMDPTVKNLNWMDLTRSMMEAADRGADHPWLLDADGNLTEGSGFNIAIVKDGVIYTPDRGVLEGITRKSMFDAAKAKGIQVRVQVVPAELAYKADELFMSTTAGGIMPATVLDGQPVNGGKVGPVTKALWDAYWAMHEDPNYSFPVEYSGKAKAKL